MSIVHIGDQDVWVDDDSEIIIAEVRGFPVVELSGHALRQMAIRDITKDQVLDTMRHPDQTGLPTEQGRHRFRKHKTTRVSIDVVFQEQPAHILVITAIKIDRRIVKRGKR